MATLRQESVYLVTKETTAANVTQESLLVEVGPLINLTSVETRLNTGGGGGGGDKGNKNVKTWGFIFVQ